LTIGKEVIMQTVAFHRALDTKPKIKTDRMKVLNEELGDMDRKLRELSRACEALTVQASQAKRQGKPFENFLEKRRQLQIKAAVLGTEKKGHLRARFLLEN
jgi:hypothetical protein